MKKKACIVLGLILSIMLGGYLYAGRVANALAASSAGGLPGVRVLGSISDRFEPVKFDHEKHVAIAGKCSACHHHANGQAELCAQCHNVNPTVFKNSVVQNFLPCSSCHTKLLNPDNPSMPSLTVAYHQKCFACHRGMEDVGVDPKGCAEMCHAKKAKSE